MSISSLYNSYARVIDESIGPFFERHTSHVVSLAVQTILLEPFSALWAGITFPSGWKEPFDFYNMNPTTLSEEQKSKPAVLLIHGNGGNQSNWLSLGSTLSNSDLGPVYTVNLPAGEVTDADWKIVEQKIKEIGHQHPGKIHLVGHSRGGGIAGQALKKWPDAIEKVVRIGAVGWHDSYQLSDRVCEITGKYDRLVDAKSMLTNSHEIDAGHLGLVYSPKAHEHVVNWLKA